MRAFDIAIATFLLRVLPPGPPKPERRLVPAVDDADGSVIDRDALDTQHAALIASLWPRAGLCLLPPRYFQLPAPAVLEATLRVTWRFAPAADAPSAFPRVEEAQVGWAA